MESKIVQSVIIQLELTHMQNEHSDTSPQQFSLHIYYFAYHGAM